MITQLLPEQIAEHWNVIKYAVENSLPPIAGNEHPDRTNRILSAALAGRISVWASYERVDEYRIKFEGVVLTKILYDDVSGTKQLLIYSIFGYNQVSKESWNQALVTLSTYAVNKKCSQIIAYTDHEYIKKIAIQLGGTSRHFISFEVNEIVKSLNNLDGGKL